MNLNERFTIYTVTQSLAKRRAAIYDRIADGLDDKASLLSIITEWRRRAVERKQSEVVVYSRWLRSLDSGRLSTAFDGSMPPNDIMMIEAYETSGDLAEGLRFTAKTVRLTSQMKDSLTAAIAMPVVVILMLIGFLLMFALKLVPTMEKIYPATDWPQMGRILWHVSNYVVHWGIPTLAVLIAGIVAFVLSLSRWNGPRRSWADKHLLPYRIYRDYQGALFMIALSAMMQSKMSLVEALRTLKRRANPWLKFHIATVTKQLDLFPTNNAEAFDTGVFSDDLTDQVIDYGRRSTFQTALGKIGLNAIDVVKTTIMKSLATLNTVLLLFCGAWLGFMFIAYIFTSFDASSGVKKRGATQAVQRPMAQLIIDQPTPAPLRYVA